MSWNIEFSPLLPTPALAVLALAGAALIALLLWRRTRGALLRAAALGLLLLALLNPRLRQEERESLSDIAVVAVDESESQRIADRDELTQTVRERMSESLGDISNLEIRWVTSPASEAAGEQTDGTMLFGDLERTLSEIPGDRLAGVVLVTDGRIHDIPQTAEVLGNEVPVHAILTGEPDEVDRRLEVLQAPRFGLVGSEQTAEVRVMDDPGGASGRTVELTITQENEPPETRRVRVGEEVEVPIRFPHAGTNIVELAVEPAPGELTEANNRAVLSAEGVRENLRVLLVSGEPHAGERTWRNLLKSDASVDLVHFTILRPPEKQDGTPINQLSLIAFPTRELFSEKLDQFDLIIFDRYHRRGVLPLLYLDNVARYVEEGGAVLIAAGEKYAEATSLYRTPLSSVLPAAPTGRVLEQPYRPSISGTGQRHPVTRGLNKETANAREWGRWFRLVEASDVRGEVLMHGPEQNPLLVLNRLQEGRIALLLSDHAWLWARGFEGGGPYTALLRRTAHWLMKEPDLEEEVLHARGENESLIIERRTMEETVEPVKVTGPSGETRRVELEETAPGIWRKALDVRDKGIYRAKSGELSAVAHVGRMNSREMTRLTASADGLEPLLEETGGGAFWTGRNTANPALPRVAMLRINTPGSSTRSDMRMRSPRMAPPENGLDGSMATMPTLRPSARSVRASRATSDDLPQPGTPVMPTTCAWPVWR
jgi:hypothetical protein